MKIDDCILLPQEKTALRLRALYAEAGFQPYRMGKFEEYELYARNKEFLASDRILTFTDVSGKLMALKPDVTLSVIKNTEPQPGPAQKLYYHETVYRVPKGGMGFREMTQVGLECIGGVTEADEAQVIALACGSLRLISENCVLDLSHFGLVQSLMDEAGLTGEAAAAALICLNDKNAHGLGEVCAAAGVPADAAARLGALIAVYGPPARALPRLREALGARPALDALSRVAAAVPAPFKDVLSIDLSVPGNLKYYSGVAFKGYVRGVPGYVLSGGRYDHLMRRLRKTGSALGFAVYLNALEGLPAKED